MNKGISKKIKLLRIASKLSTKRIAEYLGISCYKYSMYELGKKEIPLNHIEKISDLFGCELKDLFEKNVKSTNYTLSYPLTLNKLKNKDLHQIAKFKSIIKNYLKMKNISSTQRI